MLLMTDTEIIERVRDKDQEIFEWLYKHGYYPLGIDNKKVLVRYTRWLEMAKSVKIINEVFDFGGE